MHEIDITNGVAAFADSQTRTNANGTARVDAWHRLGTPVGHLMTVDEALDAAHLRGWDVRKEPLTAQLEGPMGGPDGPLVTVPDKHVVLRTNPISGKTEALGVVGNRWTPFHNEETTELLSMFVDEGGAHIETAAALRGGRDTFVTMRLPGHMEFRSPVTGELDLTDLYIAILNNHSGEAPLRALITPVRIVCANTQRMAEHAARSSVSLRHTGSPTARLTEVRATLGLTFAYRDTFVEQCEKLIDREVGNITVFDVIKQVVGVPAATTEAQATKRTERAEEIMGLYHDSPTVAPFKGTAFGAYNAVTEYLDHVAPVSGKGDEAVKRAQRTLTGWVGDMKAAAFSLLLPV